MMTWIMLAVSMQEPEVPPLSDRPGTVSTSLRGVA